MFQFKQFTIRQERTAMKVCTDACVLGAYATNRTSSPAASAILDIGTGTGLLALMAAQQYPDASVIDAVELDKDAWSQARDNVRNSPFADRIGVHHQAIQDYDPANRYDLILTNPPFFTDHLRSPSAAANRAIHTDTLSFSDLIHAVDRLLAPDGRWWVLLPPYEARLLETMASSANLWSFSRLMLRHNDRKNPFRHVTGYSRQRTASATDTLTIFEADPANPGRERYTNAFRQLLSPFYLIF